MGSKGEQEHSRTHQEVRLKECRQLLSLPPTAYVREIIFIDPSAPSATCISVNLDLKQYV